MIIIWDKTIIYNLVSGAESADKQFAVKYDCLYNP